MYILIQKRTYIIVTIFAVYCVLACYVLMPLQSKKLNCPEQDLNPWSLAYMAGILATKPPRQFHRPGINSGTYIGLVFFIETGVFGNEVADKSH